MWLAGGVFQDHDVTGWTFCSFDNSTDMADSVAVEMWKIDIKEHCRQVENRQTKSAKAYALILGQCSQTVRD